MRYMPALCTFYEGGIVWLWHNGLWTLVQQMPVSAAILIKGKTIMYYTRLYTLMHPARQHHNSSNFSKLLNIIVMDTDCSRTTEKSLLVHTEQQQKRGCCWNVTQSRIRIIRTMSLAILYMTLVRIAYFIVVTNRYLFAFNNIILHK